MHTLDLKVAKIPDIPGEIQGDGPVLYFVNDGLLTQFYCYL